MGGSWLEASAHLGRAGLSPYRAQKWESLEGKLPSRLEGLWKTEATGQISSFHPSCCISSGPHSWCPERRAGSLLGRSSCGPVGMPTNWWDQCTAWGRCSAARSPPVSRCPSPNLEEEAGRRGQKGAERMLKEVCLFSH